ncbi:response regulator [Alkalicella caledoniensis]|uniref:Stage 0 sporulation protein A homolog n=1 Tax=Alkalicella caledoniensis TaxID=2731377 RepID=A0A7G9W5Q1_ALKCA|nr:response regulator [Alkalicella caledoniensis]QNO14013.1 response regulator [Alkalicella caledoniensis]
MYKVVLADDERLEREALKIILCDDSSDTIIVGEAATGKQAVELCETHDPDVIFMDIKMPGMDGLEATEIIKKLDKDKVIIILTAYEEFKYAQRALKLGADDYVLKPARPKDILEVYMKHRDKKHVKKDVKKDVNTDSLYEAIRTEDYKESKIQLRQVLNELNEIYKDDLEQMKLSLDRIAKQILDICHLKGLNEITNNQEEIRNSMTPNNMEYAILKVLDRFFEEIINQKKIEENNEIHAALNYIEKNFKKGITLEEVAEYVHLNPHYFSKLFKKELDVNFVNYVTHRKIEYAKELLRFTDIPIINISMELSYNEPNYFSKVFKKVVGSTPTDYRNLYEEERVKNRGLKKRYTKISNGKWYV